MTNSPKARRLSANCAVVLGVFAAALAALSGPAQAAIATTVPLPAAAGQYFCVNSVYLVTSEVDATSSRLDFGGSVVCNFPAARMSGGVSVSKFNVASPGGWQQVGAGPNISCFACATAGSGGSTVDFRLRTYQANFRIVKIAPPFTGTWAPGDLESAASCTGFATYVLTCNYQRTVEVL